MKPAFFLDTSVCVAILHNREGLDSLPYPSQTAISVIVAAELWTEVRKAPPTRHSHHAARLEAFLGLFPLVDFTLEAALEYADIRVALEARGTPIGPLDLLIAAQARSLSAAVVTGNVGEFGRVEGLKVLPFG